MAKTPTKMEFLRRIFEAQRLAGRLMFEADRMKREGRLLEASEAYARLSAKLRELLAIEEEHNRHYAESQFDVTPTVNQLVNALLTHADVIEACGDLKKAEVLRSEAMDLAARYLADEDAARRLRQRAETLIPQGRFNEALEDLANARDLFQARGDTLEMASVTAFLAEVLEWLGDLERARFEAQRALNLLGSRGRAASPATSILSALGSGDLRALEEEANVSRIRLGLQQLQARVNRKLGNLTEAESQFRAVLPLLPPEVAEAGIGFHLAAIEVERGDFSRALEVIRRIEPRFTGMVRQKLGVLLWLKGQAMLGLGRAQEALSLGQSACEELARYRDLDSLWKAQWLRGRAFAVVDRPEEALSGFDDAAATIDSLRKAPLGYRLDSTYLRDKLPVFEDAIAISSARGDAQRCCRMIEMVKSRALTASLSLPPGGRKNEGEIERKIDELSRRMDAAEYRGYAEGWTGEIEQERARLQAERAELLERQRFSDPRWRSLTEPAALHVPNLQALLAQRGQCAMSLFQHGDVVTCVLVTSRSLSVASVRLSATTLQSLSRFLSNLGMERPTPELFDLSEYLQVDAEDLVPAALLEEALDASSLVMVPHGTLHVVPWGGLRFHGKRLAERIPVGVLPNLSCISMLGTAPAGPASIALIGAPDYSRLPELPSLPLARDELYAIADLYSEKGTLVAKVADGASATEQRFWELTRNACDGGYILHVSTHGDFVTGDPLSSGLLFTDGRADASEIAACRLSCDEVILSACASGFRPQEVKGIPLTGDDIVGLPGAVLEAGARSVLMSIPKAREDATMQFMVIYHQHRSSGSLPLVSFQKTQVEMLESGLYPPHLWIGFTMYGCQ